MAQNVGKSLRTMARQAKSRIKSNFWEAAKKEQAEKLMLAQQRGVNVQEAGRYLAQEMERKIQQDDQTDSFYEQVKALLLSEGEVSDAIGRLTDKEVYESLSYTEKQRYTLELSEKYLRALDRFKKECIFFGDDFVAEK